MTTSCISYKETLKIFTKDLFKTYLVKILISIKQMLFTV